MGAGAGHDTGPSRIGFVVKANVVELDVDANLERTLYELCNGTWLMERPDMNLDTTSATASMRTGRPRTGTGPSPDSSPKSKPALKSKSALKSTGKPTGKPALKSTGKPAGKSKVALRSDVGMVGSYAWKVLRARRDAIRGQSGGQSGGSGTATGTATGTAGRTASTGTASTGDVR